MAMPSDTSSTNPADVPMNPVGARAIVLAVTLAVLATAWTAWGLFLWVR